MSQLINYIIGSYNSLMSKADQRVSDWPLMSSPLPTILISSIYVIIVKKIGPYLMRNRNPFNMREIMIIYNFLMVIISALIVFYFSKYAWLKNYSFICQPVDYSNSPDAITIAKISYAYYLVKMLEFADTIFFVLRKKTSQITNLHVIHHGLLPFSVWWGMKFVPGGHATFFGYINSFIHVIMYFYYGMAAFGPKMQKYLWWKKYLTVLQMVQFVLIFIHAFQLLVVNDCNFSKIFALWIGAHGVLFWFLFSNFYDKTYKKDKKLIQKNDFKSKFENFANMCNGKQHLLYEDLKKVTKNEFNHSNNCNKSNVNNEKNSYKQNNLKSIKKIT